MAGVRIVHHSKGYAALLKHPRLQADVLRRAQAIARAAGGEQDGFVAEQSAPRVRARAAVIARYGDPDNKMIRSLDAGR